MSGQMAISVTELNLRLLFRIKKITARAPVLRIEIGNQLALQVCAYLGTQSRWVCLYAVQHWYPLQQPTHQPT